MRVLRWLTGNTIRDRIRNATIRDECDVQDIVRWARKRRRGWNDHISRMGDDRLVRIARDGRPPYSRPPGRPPKR